MIRHLSMPAFALAVTVGVSALGGVGDGDYVAVLPEHGVATGTCAKDLDSCEAFRFAIQAASFPDIPADTPSRCERHPRCFTERSLFIKGHNMPSGLRQ